MKGSSIGNFHEARVAFCFVRKWDLETEFRREPGNGTKERVVEVVTLDRECDKHTPWMQGFSPKEHAEMLNAERMEKLADERRAKDLAWQERQEQDRRKWQEEQEAKQSDKNAAKAKSDRRWQVGLAIIAAAATILNGYFVTVLWKQP